MICSVEIISVNMHYFAYVHYYISGFTWHDGVES